MIWVDDVLVSYKKAINALNYDKLGHETGLGSWGILATIEDSFDTPMSLFLGVKFDTISIITNRFVTSFINIPRELKERVGKTKSDSMLNVDVSGVSSFVPDIYADTVIEFYIDIHKVSVDVVEFLKTVYKYQDTTEEYGSLTRDTVFLSGGRRASRGISATMLRVYDGNLENFGFIFTRDGVEFVLNEMIIMDSIVHDEIKYTFWLTPHDREEYAFFKNDGNIPAESGSEYISGLGYEKMISQEPQKLYQYDRRGLRQGYYDVTVENPVINSGYFDGNVESSDTFQFAKDTLGRIHKHKAQVSFDCQFQQHIGGITASLLSGNAGPQRDTTANMAFTNLVKMTDLDIFKMNVPGSFVRTFNHFMSSGLVEDLMKSIANINPNLPASSIAKSIDMANNTCVTPMFFMNKLRDLRSIDVEEIKDCVIFIYHPVVDKFVFYEMGQNDPAEITTSSILFYSDGTKYGIDLRGSYPVFVWSNFQKRFREDISSWLGLKGDITPVGGTPQEYPDPIDTLIASTNSEIPVYDDLTFQSNCAKIIAINKNDVRDIVEKTRGVVQGDFVFGLKTGDIDVERNGLWM